MLLNRPKLLIYSDCCIYGGSEKLISFLIKNKIIQDDYEIIFAFRNHKIYENAIAKEFNTDGKNYILFPLTIASNGTFFYKINLLNIPIIIKILIKIPFFVVENLGLFFIFNFLIQIYVLIKFAPDIVHINNGGYPGASSCSTMVFASRFFGITPIVYQINNTTRKTKNPLNKYFDRYINNHVSCFITASKHSKEKLVDFRMFDADKIIQVPNTILEETITKSREIVLDELHVRQTDFVLCNIGFLFKSKGQKFLLEALSLIRIQKPHVFEKISLLLLGDGEEETNLKQYSYSLKLNKRVHFLGYQSQPINYLNCCDLFVFSSIAGEDMPLVILSAMNLGKTILATDFAGIREEIEDNISGLLILPNIDTLSQSLANKIIELYFNRQKELGENARIRYRQLFSNSIYCSTILNIYNSLIDNIDQNSNTKKHTLANSK